MTGTRAIGILVAVALAGAFPVLAGASAGAAATGTKIAAVDGPFGPMLVVGSGKYAGFTLYMITSDHGRTFGCTTKVQKVLGQPGSCAGKSNDKKAEWPAITTVGKPVAGPGVEQRLLGTVNRAGVGEQVTYAGHPLYLFENSPGEVTGEGWDEPTLPPWHGLWWLISPSGSPLAWPGTLTTVTLHGKRVLAALMFTGAGWEPFPVYSYSKDSGRSVCAGACALAWPPVLTKGVPALEDGLSASSAGSVARSGGVRQLTWDGKPLYLFSREKIDILPQGFAAAGNGNGDAAGGGTFSLVKA